MTATVVRAQRPTSAEAGNVALVLGDGTIEGFVGGVCAEHSVRAYALKAIESGEAVLLRILPFGDETPTGRGGRARGRRRDGARTRACRAARSRSSSSRSCRAPRVLVVGDTPIARALLRIGARARPRHRRASTAGDFEPRPGDLALVVAAHGRDELHALRRGLEAGLPYVGLVASRRRGDGVLGELRGDGVPEELLERIDVPAGLDIGARTPAEIALSILARIVAVRRAAAAAPVGAPPPSTRSAG